MKLIDGILFVCGGALFCSIMGMIGEDGELLARLPLHGTAGPG